MRVFNVFPRLHHEKRMIWCVASVPLASISYGPEVTLTNMCASCSASFAAWQRINFQYTSLVLLEFLFILPYDMFASKLELTQTFCLILIHWIYIYIYPMIKLYRYNMCIELSSHPTESNWFFRFNDLFVSAPRAFYSLTKVHDPCPVPCILQLMPGKNRRTASIPTPASPMQQPRHDGMCQQSESDQCSFVCQCMLHRPVPFPSQGCAKGAAYASCVLAVGMNTCRIYHALNTGILDSN